MQCHSCRCKIVLGLQAVVLAQVANPMRRREFITLLGGLGAWPLVARAEQSMTPVIGSLYAVSAAQWEPYMAGFRRGLSDAGFVEGRNVTIEYRSPYRSCRISCPCPLMAQSGGQADDFAVMQDRFNLIF
jgi:hypothetical protein